MAVVHGKRVCFLKKLFPPFFYFSHNNYPFFFTRSICFYFLILQGCLVANQEYTPRDMPGQEGSVESRAIDCQKRCVDTEDCSFFSFWADGACHLQDSSATIKTPSTAISGPSRCHSGKYE